jgi:hypothetical protein
MHGEDKDSLSQLLTQRHPAAGDMNTQLSPQCSDTLSIAKREANHYTKGCLS